MNEKKDINHSLDQFVSFDREKIEENVADQFHHKLRLNQHPKNSENTVLK